MHEDTVERYVVRQRSEHARRQLHALGGAVAVRLEVSELVDCERGVRGRTGPTHHGSRFNREASPEIAPSSLRICPGLTLHLLDDLDDPLVERQTDQAVELAEARHGTKVPRALQVRPPGFVGATEALVLQSLGMSAGVVDDDARVVDGADDERCEPHEHLRGVDGFDGSNREGARDGKGQPTLTGKRLNCQPINLSNTKNL